MLDTNLDVTLELKTGVCFPAGQPVAPRSSGEAVLDLIRGRKSNRPNEVGTMRHPSIPGGGSQPARSSLHLHSGEYYQLYVRPYTTTWVRGLYSDIDLNYLLPTRPGVYAFFSDTHLLYVGVTSNLHHRIFYGHDGLPHGRIADRRTNLDPRNLVIAFRVCKSLKFAQSLEKKLIRRLKPPLNKTKRFTSYAIPEDED